MISRKTVADAYLCCLDICRKKVRAAGIKHMRRLKLEEYREVMKVNGWPVNPHPDHQKLAELAWNKGGQISLYP